MSHAARTSFPVPATCLRLGAATLALVLWACLGTVGVALADGALDEVARDLDAKTKRLEKIDEEYKRSPQDRAIEVYAKYTRADFDGKPKYSASDMLDIIKDKTVPTDTRTRALDALKKQRPYDPDLERGRKRGRTALAKFSMEAAKCLDDGDRKCDAWARKSIHEWLGELWGNARRSESGIRDYDPANNKTWGKAVKGWRDYLKDR